jgi:hypothetical protein
MKKFALAFCIALVALTLSATIVPSLGAETPVVNTDPGSLTLQSAQTGQTIQINVTINNVQHLWAYSINNLSFNPSVLRLTAVTEGEFLQRGGQTFLLWTQFTDTLLQQGIIRQISQALSENSDVSGSGVLVTLTFAVLSQGSSQIGFDNITLTGPPFDHPLIPCSSLNGTIAIDSVTSPAPNPTSTGSTPTPSSLTSNTPISSNSPTSSASTPTSSDVPISTTNPSDNPSPSVPEFPIVYVILFFVVVISSVVVVNKKFTDKKITALN